MIFSINSQSAWRLPCGEHPVLAYTDIETKYGKKKLLALEVAGEIIEVIQPGGTPSLDKSPAKVRKLDIENNNQLPPRIGVTYTFTYLM
jgi:hypothetical protein